MRKRWMHLIGALMLALTVGVQVAGPLAQPAAAEQCSDCKFEDDEGLIIVAP